MEDYEKKYKDALAKAKEIHRNENEKRFDMEWLFPELKENDDGRVKKRILLSLEKDLMATKNSGYDTQDLEQCIAWLEKQGENANFQNKIQVDNQVTRNYDNVPANLSQLKQAAEYVDEVKPKFHEGDWVVFNGLTLYVKEVVKGFYRTISKGDDIANSYDWDIDNVARLWTIQDAKDGDVLAEDTCIFIIQKLGDNSTAAKTYCTLYNDGDFDDGTILYFDIDSTKPATKEQRDLLFSKMKEAGYEFDFEKKKLKKLTQSVTNTSDQPTWSYEDEANLNNIIMLCNNCINGSETTWIPSQATKIKHLIETIKERGLSQQKPTEWSEEDELRFNCTVGYLNRMNDANGGIFLEDINWLKSLKGRIGG